MTEKFNEDDKLNDSTFQSVINQHKNVVFKIVDKTYNFINDIEDALQTVYDREKDNIECEYMFMLKGMIMECRYAKNNIMCIKDSTINDMNCILDSRGLPKYNLDEEINKNCDE